MATYVNDLRLKEIATGDESGTWGSSTNTNLELIGNAMGVGAEAIANASTHTITMADGVADEFRSSFLRLTGGGQACTVTLAPNTLSHTWIMRNETSATLTLTQGSGANVAITAGQTKIVATDGAGSGAVVYEMDDLELAGNLVIDGDLTIGDDLTITDDLNVGDDINLTSDSSLIKFGADGDTTLTHTDGTGLTLNSTNKLTFGDAASFVQQSSDGVLRVDGEATIDLNASTAVTVSNDLKLDSDAAVLGFGADNDVTLTHVADTGLLLNSTMAIQFNDASQFINAPSATVLDINATDEIELNATLVDVNANLDVSGTYTGAGLMTTGGNIVIPDAGNIGSASDTNAIAIGADGDITLTQDLELQHDGAILSFGADDDTTLTHTDGTGLTLNSTNKLTFGDAASFVQQSSDGVLRVDGEATIDLNASTAVTVSNDLKLDSDSAVLGFGADNDTTLTHTDGSGLTLNSTNKIMFNDASQFIQGSSATVLALGATDEIDLTATAIDVNGTMDVSGAITSSAGATITVADNSDNLTLISTDADASSGPNVKLYRNSSSPADNDFLGNIKFVGRNDNSQDVQYAEQEVYILDASDGTEDGLYNVNVMTAGANTSYMQFKAGSGVVFNEDSNDIDFRVESNGNANMLFVDGGNDRVLIGTTASRTLSGIIPNLFKEGLGYNDSAMALVGNTGTDAGTAPILLFGRSRGTSNGTSTSVASGDRLGGIFFTGADGTDIESLAAVIQAVVDGTPGSNDMPGRLEFYTTPDGSESAAERMRINSLGHVGVGTTSPDTNNFGAGHGVLAVASSTGAAKTAMLNIVGDGNDTADTRVGSIFYNDASATGAGATLAGIETYRATDHATDPGGNLLFLTNNTGGSYGTKAIIRANGTVSFSTDGSFTTNTNYAFRDGVGINNPNSSSYSVSTASVLAAGSMSTGRSINATGTINASGADYAEYMYKADGCGTIAKGDVVGVDINGKLTDVFADAISFVIKSTNPSYVGGDTWSDEEPPTKDEEDTAEWDSWYERTETKRATVDRIAFSGQVPVNITGSFNVGDYVYPEVDGSSIKAVAKSSPTFDEYKLCVGKIWATEKNGKPFVAVKIG